MSFKWWGTLAGIAIGVLLVILGIMFVRPVGQDLVVNGSFENVSGKFSGGVRSIMELTNGASEIVGWVVVGFSSAKRLAWSGEDNSEHGAKDGKYFLDLTNRQETLGPTGGIKQDICTPEDSDYRLTLWVGTSPP